MDNLSYSNYFKIHPENEFTEGLNSTGHFEIGQAFIENSDNLPETANKYDYYASVTIKVFGEEHAKPVINNLKGLTAMFLMLPEVKDIKDEINFSFKNEGENVIAEVGVSDKFLESMIHGPTFNFVEKLGSHGLKISASGKIGFNPIDILSKECMDVIETAYDISIEMGGDELLRYLLQVIHKDLKRQAEMKKDVIANELAFPIVEFIEKYVDSTDKIEFDHTYDRDHLKKAIEEYNVQWGSFKKEKQHLSEFQGKIRQFLENDFKKLSQGFFGPYFKILEFVNLNSLEFNVISHFRMGRAYGKISCPGVSEYVKDNVLCYLKK